MSTPKINFFIQAGCRVKATGHCRAAGGFTNNCSGCLPGPGRAPGRPVNKQLFGLSARQLPGTGFRRAGGDAAGEDPGEYPGVPRCQHPEPEQLFPIPDPEDPDLQKERLQLRVRVAPPAGDDPDSEQLFGLSPKIPKLQSRIPMVQ